MNSLYFECNAGISGDMAVGAMLDAGADKNLLLKTLESIPLQGFKIEITRVKKNGIDCNSFTVMLDDAYENHDHDMQYLFSTDEQEHSGHFHEQHDTTHHGQHHTTEGNKQHHHEHRNMSIIADIINKTQMSENARNLALKILSLIAQAESEAHGIPVNEVHFHEVGALDSIVDIIALAVCFDDLATRFAVKNVYIPYLCEGYGTIRCQHGILSIPVPAVVNIIKKTSLQLSHIDIHGEFVTPTGAAFAAAVATRFTFPESFTIIQTGLGSGKREYAIPSIMRLFVINENGNSNNTEKVIQLEVNIDDSTGEMLGFVSELLMENGALEVNNIPCFMKKSRPTYLLTVLCTDDKCAEIEKILFKNTTTIGIRKFKVDRTILPRHIVKVQTQWGIADVKVVDVYNQKKFYPEYESIRKICKDTLLDYSAVYQEIVKIAENAQ